MDPKSKICFLSKHNTKNDAFKMHTHGCYELVYFLTGGGISIINGKSHPVSANCCCVIPPQTEHVEKMDGYGEIMFVGFQCDAVDEWLPEGVYANNPAERRTLFEGIFAEYKNQEPGFQAAADALLNLFLIAVARSSQTDERKCKDLHYIKTYIEQHADQKIRFKELAQLSGYSCDYFRHIFKQRFGIAPQEYLIDIRLRNARKMLEQTDLSCTEIAYQCGFSNSAQMSSMFKMKYGKSPVRYRISDLYKTTHDL